ncbi:MAG: hypothetical protein HY918_02935 [Candidatus Doudnabacteria bacterium]|nr:hypothetical protein [Candidatus Doudnabacteria bacterium]
MTQETPGKVFSLLGAAFASMFFLFAVTTSNASFEKMEVPFPDVFAPSQVVATLDSVANGYSNFVYANLINPAKQDYAFYADNVSFVAEEAGPSLLQIAGLQGLSSPSIAHAENGQVAGASDKIVYSKYYPSSGGVFSVFFK